MDGRVREHSVIVVSRLSWSDLNVQGSTEYMLYVLYTLCTLCILFMLCGGRRPDDQIRVDGRRIRTP